LSHCVPFWLNNLLLGQASLPLSQPRLKVVTALVLPCTRLRRARGTLNVLFFVVVEVKLRFAPPINPCKYIQFHPSLLPRSCIFSGSVRVPSSRRIQPCAWEEESKCASSEKKMYCQKSWIVLYWYSSPYWTRFLLFWRKISFLTYACLYC
jgi:hypothetical protein